MRHLFLRLSSDRFAGLWIHPSFTANSCLIILFLLLTGCATLIPSTAPTAVRTVIIEPQTDSQDTAASEFNVRGRVSVRNAQHSFSGNVHWHHTLTEDNILLFSPLGQTIAEIFKNKDTASLATAQQEKFNARNVEDLTTEVLGWQLPLDGLQYWIQGIYSPVSTAFIEFDSHDRIVAIRQDGWRIQFIRYFTEQSAMDIIRPRIIELQYDDLKIRMVVDNWI